MKTYWIIALAAAGIVAIGLILYIVQPGALLRTQVALPVASPLTCSNRLKDCEQRCKNSAEVALSCTFQCNEDYKTCNRP